MIGRRVDKTRRCFILRLLNSLFDYCHDDGWYHDDWQVESLEVALDATRSSFESALIKESDYYEKLRRELEEKHHVAHKRIVDAQDKLKSRVISKQCELRDWLGK